MSIQVPSWPNGLRQHQENMERRTLFPLKHLRVAIFSISFSHFLPPATSPLSAGPTSRQTGLPSTSRKYLQALTRMEGEIFLHKASESKTQLMTKKNQLTKCIKSLVSDWAWRGYTAAGGPESSPTPQQLSHCFSWENFSQEQNFTDAQPCELPAMSFASPRTCGEPSSYNVSPKSFFSPRATFPLSVL